MRRLDLPAKSHQVISNAPCNTKDGSLPQMNTCILFPKGMNHNAQCEWYLILSLRHCIRALVHIPRSAKNPDTQTLKCFTLRSKRTLYYVYIEHEQCGKHWRFCISGLVFGQHWEWRCSRSRRVCVTRCAMCHQEPKLPTRKSPSLALSLLAPLVPQLSAELSAFPQFHLGLAIVVPWNS